MSLFAPNQAQLLAEHTFSCAVCRQTAATLRLFYPARQSDNGVLELSAFLGHSERVVNDTGYLAQLIAAGAAAQLYQYDLEFAPCYCPPCDAHYCADHWQQEEVYDDGFYDCTYGVCPRGHRRLIDD
jgi:hypothetical protein